MTYEPTEPDELSFDSPNDDPDPGEYDATVVAIRPNYDNSGNPKAIWSFELDGNPPGVLEVHTITDPHHKAFFKTHDFAVALRIYQSGGRTNLRNAVGKRCRVRVIVDTFWDPPRKTVEKILRVLPDAPDAPPLREEAQPDGEPKPDDAFRGV